MEQIKGHKRLLMLSCAAILAGMAGGCNKVNNLVIDGTDYLLLRDANLKERNYAAADYLVSRSGKYIDKKTVIVPEPLIHMNDTGMTSPFGAEVSYQIAERFDQLGYNVRLVQNNPAQPRDGVFVRSDEGVAIGGLYEPHWNSAEIKLRLIDRRTGEVLSFFDYSLPINWQTHGSVKDRPTAYRVQE